MEKDLLKNRLKDELKQEFNLAMHTKYAFRIHGKKDTSYYSEKLTDEFFRIFKIDQFVDKLTKHFTQLVNDFNIALDNPRYSNVLKIFLLRDVVQDLFTALDLDSYFNSTVDALSYADVKSTLKQRFKIFSCELFSVNDFNKRDDVLLGFEYDPPINYFLTPTFTKYEILFGLATLNEKKIEMALAKRNRPNFLQPGDETYDRYIKFCEKMLTNPKMSKYSVVKIYCNEAMNIDKDARSISNTFDSFLKNHKKEILKYFNITEIFYKERFFKKKLPTN